jgi:hypothetical protein
MSSVPSGPNGATTSARVSITVKEPPPALLEPPVSFHAPESMPTVTSPATKSPVR